MSAKATRADRSTPSAAFTRGRGALGEGSGLGLAIVREIAALHGATVTLKTSKFGGLEVILSFPGYDVNR